MIVLYHCMSARSFRPLWMLEELGLPCDLRMLPFPPRVFKREYLETNPLGTIPLMIDGESRMTESSAICQYLAVKHSPRALNVEPDEAGFADYLNFLHFGEATLTFPQTLLLRYGQFEPPERRHPQVVDDYGKWFLARLRTLEPRLEASPYLAAGRFTAADVSVGYALMLAQVLRLSDRFTPAIAAYWQRLSQRPAFLSALQVQQRAAQEQGVPTGSSAA
jgi:glutathione S-transferase